MSEFTEGPWETIGAQGCAIWAGPNIIAQVTGARAFHKIARANAQLISAAPDLLAALTNLLALVEGECPSLLENDHHSEMARAAISKALGTTTNPNTPAA